jgi:hypothetical protein
MKITIYPLSKADYIPDDYKINAQIMAKYFTKSLVLEVDKANNQHNPFSPYTFGDIVRAVYGQLKIDGNELEKSQVKLIKIRHHIKNPQEELCQLCAHLDQNVDDSLTSAASGVSTVLVENFLVEEVKTSMTLACPRFEFLIFG